MKPDKLARFRELLLARQREILATAASAKAAAATVELDQTSVGRLSRMDAMQGQAMSKALNARTAMELKKIEAALKRIDSDDYGDCDDCGEPIAEARLEFDPTVTLCVDCAEIREK